MLETGPYPYPLKQRVAGPRGHLSNADCAVLAASLVKNGAQRLILAHLSEKNNTPGAARLETEAALLAEQLHCELVVAPRDEMTEPIALGNKGAFSCCPSA